MRILDHYIRTKLGQGYLVVMCALVSAFTLLAFAEDLDDVGKGQYQLVDACVYMVLTLPRRMVDLAPIVGLLGSLMALGRLATGNELVAMRAVGVSAHRIAWSVIKTGALLMLAVVVLEEFLAPPLDQLALTQRSLAISQTGNLRTEHGFWSRDGLRFINVHQVLHGRIPADIDIYQFDEQGHLRVFTHARQANTEDPAQWLLTDVEQKVIDGQDVTTQSLSSLPWKSFLSPDQIGILVLPSETLSLSDLYQFVRYLREREQSTGQYELALWQMVSMPVATGAMVLMSISFVFGPLRAATAGKRIMVGSIVGVAFHLASQILGHFGEMYDLDPALTTLTPPGAILVIALWLFRRIP